MAAVLCGVCSWCRSARWQYKCSTCDPRREKALCANCSMLWHSRGFARSHELTSSYGETRSFLAWGFPGVSNGIDGAAIESSGVAHGTQTQEVAVDGVEDTKSTATEKEEKPKEEDTKPKAPATDEEAKDGQEETKQEEEKNEEIEEEYEFEVMGESADSGDAMSVEQDDELEEKAKDIPAEEISTARTSSVSESKLTIEREVADQHSELNKHQSSAPATSTPSSVPKTAPPAPDTKYPGGAVTPSVDGVASPAPVVVSAAAPASSTPRTDSASATSTSPFRIRKPASASAAVAHSPAERTPRSTAQSKPADLEKLLRWFPTTDNVLMEMLAARIEDALVIEDALICARIGKCEESACRSVLLHYEHCKRDEMCGDPKCSEISIIYKHRRACLKKDTAPSIDDKTFVCPFCIRIRQRRSLGVCAALDHLIIDQRRALQGAHSEANRNFCLQSINRWTERKKHLRAETERLNQQARESSAPIFNFPKYQRHFSDNVFIKREPTPLEANEDTTSGQSAAEISTDDSDMMPAAQQISQTHEGGDNSLTPDGEASAQQSQSQDTQEDSIPGTANFNANFIHQLLRAKAESGDNNEMTQREIDGVMELGYAIVDASFCAPSKAQRCLLNCTSILDHLQHHLDLKVCNQPMCGAVEHHFAHLSQCVACNESESCEYCLRMEERRLIRSVDFMEAELPEAEAKVQKIINDITASFTNHRPDEREQEMIQLEDELDQAEANKQELLEKLSAARTDLRKVRRSMEHRGISTSSSRRLPVHFTKTRRSEGSGSNKKRRLADSSE